MGETECLHQIRAMKKGPLGCLGCIRGYTIPNSIGIVIKQHKDGYLTTTIMESNSSSFYHFSDLGSIETSSEGDLDPYLEDHPIL